MNYAFLLTFPFEHPAIDHRSGNRHARDPSRRLEALNLRIKDADRSICMDQARPRLGSSRYPSSVSLLPFPPVAGTQPASSVRSSSPSAFRISADPSIALQIIISTSPHLQALQTSRPTDLEEVVLSLRLREANQVLIATPMHVLWASLLVIVPRGHGIASLCKFVRKTGMKIPAKFSPFGEAQLSAGCSKPSIIGRITPPLLVDLIIRRVASIQYLTTSEFCRRARVRANCASRSPSRPR